MKTTTQQPTTQPAMPTDAAVLAASGPKRSRRLVFSDLIDLYTGYGFWGGLVSGCILMLFTDVSLLYGQITGMLLIIMCAFLGLVMGLAMGVLYGLVTSMCCYPMRAPARYRLQLSGVLLAVALAAGVYFRNEIFSPRGVISTAATFLLAVLMPLCYALWATLRIADRTIARAGMADILSYRPAPQVLDFYDRATQRALFDMAPEIANRMEYLAGLGMLARWRGALLARLEVRPGMRVVDLMAGTGALSRALVRRAGAGNVTAVEFAPRAAALVRRVAGVNVVEADALANGLPSGGADVVTCAFGTLGLMRDDHVLLADEVDRLLEANGVAGLVDLSLPQNPVLRWAYLGYLERIPPRLGKLFLDRPELYVLLQRYVRESVGLGLLAYEFESRGYTVALTPLEGGLATALVVMKQGVEE